MAMSGSQSRLQSQSQLPSSPPLSSRQSSQSSQLGDWLKSFRCRCRSLSHLFGVLHLYGIVLFILAHCTTVQAGVAQDSVIWIYPEGGEMFYFLDTVNVTYQSSMSDLWLFIICYKDKTVNSLTETTARSLAHRVLFPHYGLELAELTLSARRVVRMQEAEPYDGSMLVPMNFTTSTSCWFSLRGSTTDDNGSNSDDWTLADVERSGGPVIIGEDGETSTSTATSSGSAAATATDASGSSSSADSSDGLGEGAKIGLGIGIGLGTSALCLGAFWWYHRYLKRKEHEQEMYRKVLGRSDGGGVSPGATGFPQHPINHANDWQHQTQPPVASVDGSSYSMGSGHTNDWHSREPSSPYQYYDPIRTGHPTSTGMAGAIPTNVPPGVAAQVVENRDATPFRVNTTPEPVPDAAAARSVTSQTYPNFGAEGPTTGSDVAQRRVLSVNYGPAGRLDAGTGADFSLLPDYQSPTSRRPDNGSPSQEEPYSPSTPTTPPPPHSAHTRTTAPPIHTIQPSVSGSSAAATSVAPSELPTLQTHRGFGPDAELPGDGQQPMLRHQRSNLHDAEQKFLMADIEPLRQNGGPSSQT